MSALPLKGTEYIFYIGLTDNLNPDAFKASPTIAAGDFQLSIDGGAFANLATLPVVTPAGSVMVKVTVTAAEMSAEKVNVVGIDQTPSKEWRDIIITVEVPTGNVETLTDLQEGDRIESNTSLVINKAGTSETLLDKTISGSLLSSGVTITTTDT